MEKHRGNQEVLSQASMPEVESGFKEKGRSHHQELGVALSKNEELDLAAESLQAAIERNPRGYDALSVLGGVYRRLGMKEAPNNFDWPSLREARNFYQRG